MIRCENYYVNYGPVINTVFKGFPFLDSFFKETQQFLWNRKHEFWFRFRFQFFSFYWFVIIMIRESHFCWTSDWNCWLWKFAIFSLWSEVTWINRLSNTMTEDCSIHLFHLLFGFLFSDLYHGFWLTIQTLNIIQKILSFVHSKSFCLISWNQLWIFGISFSQLTFCYVSLFLLSILITTS